MQEPSPAEIEDYKRRFRATMTRAADDVYEELRKEAIEDGWDEEIDGPLTQHLAGIEPLREPKEVRDMERRVSMFIPGPRYYDNDQWDGAPCFIVDELLPYTYLAVLGGNSKAGKTCFATALAMAVAKGEPFMDLAVEPGAVLWCAYEESRRERLLTMRHFGDIPENFYTTHLQPKLDDPADIESLDYWVRRTGASLIVVDPLFGATRANLTDGRGARDAMMGLKNICLHRGCAALVLHHVNKDVHAGLTRERFAESNQILATASMDILMDSREKPDGSREIRLQSRGRGDFANRTWLLRSTGPADFEIIGNGEAETGKTTLKGEVVLNVLRDSATPLSAEDVAQACGIQVQTARNLLGAFARTGEVVLTGKENRRKLYTVPPAA